VPAEGFFVSMVAEFFVALRRDDTLATGKLTIMNTLLSKRFSLMAHRICYHTVLCVAFSFLVSSTLSADETMEAKVKRVIDGDSILVVDSNDMEFEAQLEGIDAPEMKQEFGKESLEALTKMLKDQKVKLTWKSKDTYDRLLAQVYLEDKHINVEMLRSGMAWHFKRYNKSEELAKIESEAKQAKKGLWAKESPVAPWDYRKENKAPDKPAK
jgi:endonuclease YncB( thermonuclease family)